jgi:hypothetical protein
VKKLTTWLNDFPKKLGSQAGKWAPSKRNHTSKVIMYSTGKDGTKNDQIKQMDHTMLKNGAENRGQHLQYSKFE